MDRGVLELLAKLHGVQFTENTSDEDLAKSLEEAVQAATKPTTPPPTTPPPPSPPTPPSPPANPSPSPTSRLTPAMAEQLRRMSEDNDYIKAVLTELEDQRRRVAELEVANRLQDVRRKIGDVGNGRRILAPQASTKLSELVAAMPPKAGDKVLEVVKEILDDGGTVELGERGRAVIDGGKDAGTRFNAEVQKLMEADPNISYADATSAVAAANPDLFESYRYSATSEWR